MTDPIELVRTGCDRIAAAYLRRNEEDLGPATRFMPTLRDTLPAGARVLDLGCSAGVRTRLLEDRFRLVGVDLSAEQLRLAHARLPGPMLLQADMTRLSFRPGSFDAVVALYSLIHVPREHHADVLRGISTWLRPGGRFLACLGSGDDPSSIELDWLGVPMFWSGFDAATNERMLAEAGLETQIAELVTDGDETFLWVLASKRSD